MAGVGARLGPVGDGAFGGGATSLEEEPTSLEEEPTSYNLNSSRLYLAALAWWAWFKMNARCSIPNSILAISASENGANASPVCAAAEAVACRLPALPALHQAHKDAMRKPIAERVLRGLGVGPRGGGLTLTLNPTRQSINQSIKSSKRHTSTREATSQRNHTGKNSKRRDAKRRRLGGLRASRASVSLRDSLYVYKLFTEACEKLPRTRKTTSDVSSS